MRPCRSATEAADSSRVCLRLFRGPRSLSDSLAPFLSVFMVAGSLLARERIVGDYGKPRSLWTGGRSEVPPSAMTERSSRNNHPSVPSVLFSSRRYTSRPKYKVVGRVRPINHLRAMETRPETPATIICIERRREPRASQLSLLLLFPPAIDTLAAFRLNLPFRQPTPRRDQLANTSQVTDGSR